MIKIREYLNDFKNLGEAFLKNSDFMALLNTLEAHVIINDMETFVMSDNQNYVRLKAVAAKTEKETRQLEILDFDILCNKKRPSVAFQITNWGSEESLSATTMYYFEQKGDIVVTDKPKIEINEDTVTCYESHGCKRIGNIKI